MVCAGFDCCAGRASCASVPIFHRWRRLLCIRAVAMQLCAVRRRSLLPHRLLCWCCCAGPPQVVFSGRVRREEATRGRQWQRCCVCIGRCRPRRSSSDGRGGDAGGQGCRGVVGRQWRQEEAARQGDDHRLERLRHTTEQEETAHQEEGGRGGCTVTGSGYADTSGCVYGRDAEVGPRRRHGDGCCSVTTQACDCTSARECCCSGTVAVAVTVAAGTSASTGVVVGRPSRDVSAGVVPCCTVADCPPVCATVQAGRCWQRRLCKPAVDRQVPTKGDGGHRWQRGEHFE
jgi:hypothetical protein